MSAYVIVDIDVHDPAGFEEYRRQVPASLAKHGGRFVVRGGAFQVLEGSWAPKRLVMLEFESVEQAQRWYDSDDYRPLKAMRFRTSTANLILVEGAYRSATHESLAPPAKSERSADERRAGVQRLARSRAALRAAAREGPTAAPC